VIRFDDIWLGEDLNARHTVVVGVGVVVGVDVDTVVAWPYRIEKLGAWQLGLGSPARGRSPPECRCRSNPSCQCCCR
jgi:hypothetical protein